MTCAGRPDGFWLIVFDLKLELSISYMLYIREKINSVERCRFQSTRRLSKVSHTGKFRLPMQRVGLAIICPRLPPSEARLCSSLYQLEEMRIALAAARSGVAHPTPSRMEPVGGVGGTAFIGSKDGESPGSVYEKVSLRFDGLRISIRGVLTSEVVLGSEYAAMWQGVRGAAFVVSEVGESPLPSIRR